MRGDEAAAAAQRAAAAEAAAASDVRGQLEQAQLQLQVAPLPGAPPTARERGCRACLQAPGLPAGSRPACKLQ